jgi:threonine/homoserine/homoserine lactone efflux protein
MAERPAWPVVLAARWRSRPGVVRVAAGLLGLFGLLLVLVEADEGQLGVAVVVTGLVLLVTAIALGWAGRLGYWLGLIVAALLALLLVVALARRPEAAGGVVTAVGAVPLVLLLMPAARRPRRTAKPAPASAAAQEQPHGWRRPFAGWGQFAFMLIGGGLLSAGGLVLALTGWGADRGAGATIALFFLACLLAAPLLAPGRRRGRLRLEAVRLGERQERGILVPHSGWRTALLLGVIACLALAMLGLVVFADAFADDPGQSPWPMRLLGTVGVVFFGLGGLVFAYRGRGRRWRVLLTPSAVVIAAGGARTVVPWEAIQQVRATEVTTRVRGVALSEPLVGIDLSDPQAIQTGPLERLLLPWSRRLGADLTLPIRTLGIDPRLLYQALRYYHQHPQARAELATETGLARVQHGQFTTTQAASR